MILIPACNGNIRVVVHCDPRIRITDAAVPSCYQDISTGHVRMYPIIIIHVMIISHELNMPSL